MGSKSSVVVGYKYYLGMHMVGPYGPVDEVQDIIVGDRSLGDTNAGVFPITASGPVTISSPELFGGDDREGGIEGKMDVSFGDVATPNAYLQSVIGPRMPSYLGVVSFILNKMHLTSMNPYIKQWAFKFKRTLVKTDGTGQWYVAKADIGGQCNPAHIVREILTNTEWGMGYPESSVDDTDFQAAADQLYDEGFGMFMKWSSSAKIKEVIAEIQRTADCILYQGAADGLFKLKLIRGGYDTGSLTAFDETNIVAVSKYEHKGWGETVNEVTVEWTDVENRGKITSVTVQDLGNIQMQGTVIGIKKAYHGITNATLAARVAQRDLRVLTVPLGNLELTVNREGWDLGVGDVFKFSWAKYGVEQAFYRVMKISKGTLAQGQIKINALEDVFSLPDAVYVTPQPPMWTIPNNPPQPVVEQMIFPVGYWDIQQKLPQANIETLDPDFAGAFVSATVATTDTFNYKMYENTEAENVGSGQPSSFGTLNAAIDQVTDIVEIRNGHRLSLVTAGANRYISIDNELMRIDTIVYQDSSPTFALLTVGRGALDTVPVYHSVDSPIWFPSQFAGYETTTERVAGESVSYGLLPVTSLGTLDPADPGIVDLNYTLIDRYQSPYPPGYLQINGVYLDSRASDNNIVFTWQHRNRILDTGDIISKDDDSGPGEADENVQYRLQLLNNVGAIIAGYDPPITIATDPLVPATGLSHTFDNLPFLYPQITIKLWAEYTSPVLLESWQMWEYTFLTPAGAQHSKLTTPNRQHSSAEHL